MQDRVTQGREPPAAGLGADHLPPKQLDEHEFAHARDDGHSARRGLVDLADQPLHRRQQPVGTVLRGVRHHHLRQLRRQRLKVQHTRFDEATQNACAPPRALIPHGRNAMPRRRRHVVARAEQAIRIARTEEVGGSPGKDEHIAASHSHACGAHVEPQIAFDHDMHADRAGRTKRRRRRVDHPFAVRLEAVLQALRYADVAQQARQHVHPLDVGQHRSGRRIDQDLRKLGQRQLLMRIRYCDSLYSFVYQGESHG